MVALSRSWPEGLVINALQRDTAGTERSKLCPVPRENAGQSFCVAPSRSLGAPSKSLSQCWRLDKPESLDIVLLSLELVGVSLLQTGQDIC